MLSIPFESQKHRLVYGNSEVSSKLNIYLNTDKTLDYMFSCFKVRISSLKKKKIRKKINTKK